MFLNSSLVSVLFRQCFDTDSRMTRRASSLRVTRTSNLLLLLLLLLWLAPLRVHSATGCQQLASRVVRSGPGRLRRSMTARGSRGRSAPCSSRSSAVVLVVSSIANVAQKLSTLSHVYVYHHVKL